MMKIVYTLFFTCVFTCVFCHECPQVKDCPLGSYERFTGACECCSECTTYLTEDKPCTPDGIRCSPGQECNSKTKTCRPIFLSIHCLRAFGVCNEPLAPGCANDDVLPPDHRKCRCCPMCAKDVAGDGTGCMDGFVCDQNTGKCNRVA